MTTLRSVIQRAYRLSNLIPISRAPTDPEVDEALAWLTEIISSVYGNELGEQLHLFPLGQNNISVPSGYPWGNGYPPQQWWAPLNVRVVCNLTGAFADPPVYLHPAPQDGSRLGVVDASNNFGTYNLVLNGNGRMIEGQPEITLSTDGAKVDWLYRADLGNWQRVTPLGADDDMPFPDEFNPMFIGMLATVLDPTNGQSLPQEVASMMARSRGQFQARYKQIIATPSEPGLLSPSAQTYPNNRRPWGPQPSVGDSGYTLTTPWWPW